MKSLILFKFLFLLLLSSQATYAEYNCEDLVGDWQTRRYDETFKAYVVTNASYQKDNSWAFEMIIDDALSEFIHAESGRWECNDSEFVMHVQEINNVKGEEEITHKYKILNLDYNFFRFEAATENCADVISDCNGTIFESTRRVDGT